MSEGSLGRAEARYIDLLRRSVLGETHFENELRIRYLRRCAKAADTFDEKVLHEIRRYRPEGIEAFARQIEDGFPINTDLSDLPFCYTMLGKARLANVEHCVRTVLEEGIPGDLIECGVWRGGSVVFMRGLLAAFEVTDRIVWVADSFEGLPPPTTAPDLELGIDLSRERVPALAIDIDTVKRAFSAHGLLDQQVRFLKGWFSETLAEAPIEQLALLRLDGDLYSSTRDALVALYDRVVPGGFVVVDDYFLPCCRKAVEEFLVERGIQVPIERIDWTGVLFRKPR